MKIEEVADDIIEKIIRENTSLKEFDLKLSQVEVKFRMKNIKKQLSDAMVGPVRRQQEL